MPLLHSLSAPPGSSVSRPEIGSPTALETAPEMLQGCFCFVFGEVLAT